MAVSDRSVWLIWLSDSHKKGQPSVLTGCVVHVFILVMVLLYAGARALLFGGGRGPGHRVHRRGGRHHAEKGDGAERCVASEAMVGQHVRCG